MTETKNRTPYIQPLSRDALIAYIRSRRPQSQVAADFGVSVQAVEGWLAGKINPSRTVLILGALLARQQAGEWPLD